MRGSGRTADNHSPAALRCLPVSCAAARPARSVAVYLYQGICRRGSGWAGEPCRACKNVEHRLTHKQQQQQQHQQRQQRQQRRRRWWLSGYTVLYLYNTQATTRRPISPWFSVLFTLLSPTTTLHPPAAPNVHPIDCSIHLPPS